VEAMENFKVGVW